MRACLPLPVYQTLNQGTQHEPQFRSKVIVDGIAFTSPSAYPTVKMAEQEIAKLALIYTVKKVKEEAPALLREHPLHSKAILNQYVQKMNLTRKFTTEAEGWPPEHVSTLHLNGAAYTGEPARSRKDAEQFAARSAILSILGSETGTTMSEIARSQFKLFCALEKTTTSQKNDEPAEPNRANIPQVPALPVNTQNTNGPGHMIRQQEPYSLTNGPGNMIRQQEPASVSSGTSSFVQGPQIEGQQVQIALWQATPAGTPGHALPAEGQQVTNSTTDKPGHMIRERETSPVTHVRSHVQASPNEALQCQPVLVQGSPTGTQSPPSTWALPFVGRQLSSSTNNALGHMIGEHHASQVTYGKPHVQTSQIEGLQVQPVFIQGPPTGSHLQSPPGTHAMPVEGQQPMYLTTSGLVQPVQVMDPRFANLPFQPQPVTGMHVQPGPVQGPASLTLPVHLQPQPVEHQHNALHKRKEAEPSQGTLSYYAGTSVPGSPQPHLQPHPNQDGSPEFGMQHSHVLQATYVDPGAFKRRRSEAHLPISMPDSIVFVPQVVNFPPLCSSCGKKTDQ